MPWAGPAAPTSPTHPCLLGALAGDGQNICLAEPTVTPRHTSALSGTQAHGLSHGALCWKPLQSLRAGLGRTQDPARGRAWAHPGAPTTCVMQPAVAGPQGRSTPPSMSLQHPPCCPGLVPFSSGTDLTQHWGGPGSTWPLGLACVLWAGVACGPHSSATAGARAEELWAWAPAADSPPCRLGTSRPGVHGC